MKQQQRLGKSGEELAANALRRVGVSMVERIGTPVLLLPFHRVPGAFKVIWGEKVSGDHRGILEGSGRSVLAETKTIWDRNLRWSDLRTHQPGRLDMHREYGGISLLVWVHSSGVYVMRWPVEGFGPAHGLTPQRAMELSIENIASEEK